MKSAKDITLIAMYSALLIGVQFILSSLLGVELVSVMLALYSLTFGAKRGMATAVVFSLLRCIIFGFFPSVIILYLIYYPSFALVFGLLKGIKYKIYPIFCIVITTLTICFSLLDDVITPLVLSFSTIGAWKSYFLASLPVLLTHSVSVGVSAAVLFYPLSRVLSKLSIQYFNDSVND